MPAAAAPRRTAPVVGRAGLLAVVAVLLAGLLSACSSLQGSGNKGYVTGDGRITQLAPEDRADPIELSGEDLEGDDVALKDFRGKVLVINVWGAWCTDCRKEAPDLVSAANESDPDEVAFLGIDARDASRDNALGYVRTFDVPFRSIFDPKGTTLLEFRGTLTPNSIPSTVILDREGRVAASILGILPSKTTLTTLIEEIAAEGGSGAGDG